MIEIDQKYEIFSNWKEYVKVETTYMCCQITDTFKVTLKDDSVEERIAGDWLIKDIKTGEVSSMSNEDFQIKFKEKAFV